MANGDGEVADQTTTAWTALTRIQRRVAGVLVEKAKTTPSAYPLTLNGIVTAANQKSNRSPVMNLSEEQVENALYALRKLGAAVEVQSSGRVPKFRHQLYEWLGVDKVELAVMAELMLRGEQTLGDLRARASRMNKIDGLAELRPVLQSLVEKRLVVELTPAGRGQLVSHNLYQPDELERLTKDVGVAGADSTASVSSVTTPAREDDVVTEAADPQSQHDSGNSAEHAIESRVSKLEHVVQSLQETIADLKRLIED